MATMFGRFEVQGELSRSETALIYKALDTETNQVVALKTQSLERLGDRADAFVETLIAEGESTRDLVHQNIVPLFGAGEIDGQFCAAMEYIQGNSVATMLARKEGFSIWDLLDITRQVCAALDYAASKDVTHNSLEPAKLMVQWDGMVKILGYGISNMGLIAAESGNGLGRLMLYCSPEQLRGEAIDLRSNLFTLGTILYEMVVGRLAFEASDPVELLSRIENEMPAAPSAVNPKIQPVLSAAIMKALAKDPAERYQSAREFLNELELCKENKKAVTDAKKPAGPATMVQDPAARAAAASKFVKPSSVTQSQPPARTTEALPARASAAAAGASAGTAWSSASQPKVDSDFGLNSSDHMSSPGEPAQECGHDSGMEMISALDSGGSGPRASSTMSAAAAKPAPRIAVDPAMCEPAPSSATRSFSDLDELPPLKEPVFVEPAPPPQPEERASVGTQIYPKREKDGKPAVQPREVAEKAMKEISTIPPRLMLFAILGAVAVILVIAAGIFWHVRSEDDGSTAAPRPAKVVQAAPTPAPAPHVAETPAPAANPAPVAPIIDPQPDLTVRQVEKHAPARRAAAPPPKPAVVVGQALIDSTPQGAQFQVDGKSDPLYVTPYTLTGLTAGKHFITLTKSGYSQEVRSIDVAANSQVSLVLHLSPMNALMAVNSTPEGASISIDGKPTSRLTPAQFAIEKGSHTVLVRKQGYLDETVTAELAPGQNFQFAPTLRALGNVEEMKTVGKFKLFGRGNDSAAGMGTVSVHTLPKGAQVSINQRMLDKLSPVDVMLGPGNYIVDITLTGFKPVHKVVTVDKGGKVAVDESLERQ